MQRYDYFRNYQNFLRKNFDFYAKKCPKLTFINSGRFLYLIYIIYMGLFFRKFQHEGLSRFHLHILREVNKASCQDIFCTLHIPDNFSIAFYVERCRLRGTIENGHHSIAMPTSGNDVDAVIWNELRLVAADDGLIALAPVEQSA